MSKDIIGKTKNIFASVAAFDENPKWNDLIARESGLYSKSDDIRSEIARDYTRILHCTAYRRLKHKTQVFFSPQNDHICTRIEHVNHVESVSFTIANYLGLNTELTKAIAIGHDLGHAPFGHDGEKVLKQIAMRDIGDSFWHEKNGLHYVDNIELLNNNNGFKDNLNLTYAVRDGIISHCGEVNEVAIFPRDEKIDLDLFNKPNKFQPYTWEGCIVKLSDKISYLGRDIEDALKLKILSINQLKELNTIIKSNDKCKNICLKDVNNTTLIHSFIINLFEKSSPSNGIVFNEPYLELIDMVKEFNIKNIYLHERLDGYKRYAIVVINEIYNLFKNQYDGANTVEKLRKLEYAYPKLIGNFIEWLSQYIDGDRNKMSKLANKVIYNISENEKDYYKAIVDYISGMTDKFAENVYKEMISF